MPPFPNRTGTLTLLPKSIMSKLWIVHRNPQARAALARIAGLASEDVSLGAPVESAFAHASSATAIVLGLEGDFEVELEFVHRLHDRATVRSLILLAAPEDAAEAARLFGVDEAEILEPAPTARILRARISQAFARRQSESLGARRARQRIADRFSAWLGGIEVPGLLRALDPSLSNLPLLVRGVPGSGRALLARYAELFRGARESGPTRAARPGRSPSTLRIHARDIDGPADLARRIAAGRAADDSAETLIWIDEVDSLSVSAQNALAEWIVHEAPPGPASDAPPRWIATARPRAWRDELEPALEHAFMPLVLEVPALAGRPGAMAEFAQEITHDWTRSVGGVPRALSAAALAELERYPWQEDRSEVEAVLRATLASTARNPIEPEDLLFPLTEAEFVDESGDAADQDGPATGAQDPVRHVRPREDSPEPVAVVEATHEHDALAEVELEGAEVEPVDWARTSEPAWPDPDASVSTDPSSAEALAAAALSPQPEDFDESTLLSEASFAIAEPNADPNAAERSSETSAQTAPSDPGALSDPAGPAAPGWPADPGWRRLARSLSHEIRNPLVSIRTFAELLPEHYEDETFRARFAELVGRDVAHINSVVSRLQDIAENEASAPEALDVSAMLESLLEERRERFAQGRLLVLRELERDAPLAWAEANGLRVALAGLLDRALDTLPERGDLFVATRRIERSNEREARLRILLRYHNPELAAADTRTTDLEELRPSANVLEFVLAETVAAAHGGTLVIDSSDAQETVILMDLRTP